jgi:hypothetical protein
MRITKPEIDEIYKRMQSKYGGIKEDYFALLYLAKEFKLNLEEAANNQVAFGGTDYGIDAFHFDELRRNLYLYQFKWCADPMLFKDSFQRLIKDGMERIFGNPRQDPNQNQVLIKLKTCLAENRSIIDKILIHFVFNGDVETAERSRVLDRLREDLYDKKFLVEQYFEGQKVQLIIQYISNVRQERTNIIQVSAAAHKYEFEIAGKIGMDSFDKKLYVFFIPLHKLLDMYNDLGPMFFSKNIRSGLPEDKNTNREIRRSLRRIVLEGEAVDDFTFYHNGIALTAERVEEKESSNIISLVEPRILNGAQTVTSLKEFSEKNRGNISFNQNIERFRGIKVLAKVVHSTNDDFIRSVTINNNRQNPVMPWNLRANDIVQLHFEDKFRNELKIYYERQENAFRNLTDLDKEQIGIVDSKSIEIRKLAQTFLAMQGQIEKFSSIPEVFENQNYYEDAFKERYLRVDARKLVLFYKVQFKLSSIINEFEEKWAKYWYIDKARYLLWSLLIQGLLNNERFDTYLNDYGNSLVIEGDFTALLKDIALKQIRHIISKALEDRRYAKYLAENRYSFLRSRATYNHCMEVAHKLYKWEKLNP